MGTNAAFLLAQVFVLCFGLLFNSASAQSGTIFVEPLEPLDAEAVAVLRDNLSGVLEIANNWTGDAATDACNYWRGIKCTLLGGGLYIIQLELNGIGLSAVPNFSGLSNLLQIDLSNNQLTSLPTWIGSLSNLSVIFLENNSLSSIPNEFSQLTALSQLHMAHNQVSGSIAPVLGSPQDRELVHLDLGYNKLDGDFPDFIDMLALQNLILRNNSFSELPVLPFLPSLRFLELSNNNFQGELPALSGTITPNLAILDLSGNNFTGPLPDFSTFYTLSSVDLSDNQLTGPLNLPAKASLIDFSGNKLSGFLPDFSQFPEIISLFLSENNFSGPLLPIANSEYFTKLDLSHNNLEGPLPRISNSTTDVFLGHNNFSGDAEEAFGELRSLARCSLSDNNPALICPVTFTVCCATYSTTTSSSLSTSLSSVTSSSSTLTSSSSTSALSISTTSSSATASSAATTSSGCGIHRCVCSSNLTALTTITTCSNGTWVIDGPVKNNNTVSVAQGDVVLINGSFVQNPQAILQISTNGSEGGSIQVSGAAQLGGILVIIVTSHNTGSNTINIINAAEIAGEFNDIRVDKQFGDAGCYATSVDPQYDTTSLSVLITTTKKVSCSNKGKIIGIAIGVSLGGAVIIVLITVVAIVFYKKLKSPDRIKPVSHSGLL